MLLTISRTRHASGLPATDLGFLLAKHPDRAASFEVASGRAHVFYPVATEELTTAALILDVDPVGIVRGSLSGKNSGSAPLAGYVNPRPYVATACSRSRSTRCSGPRSPAGAPLGPNCRRSPGHSRSRSGRSAVVN